MSSEPDQDSLNLEAIVAEASRQLGHEVKLAPPDDPIYTEMGVRIRWSTFPRPAPPDAGPPSTSPDADPVE